MNVNFAAAKWLNQPKLFEMSDQSVKSATEPNTDLWQRTLDSSQVSAV